MQSDKGLVVGIDASNIRSGGGLLHLQKILSELGDVADYDIREVRLWVSPSVVDGLPSRSWLKTFPVKWFDSLPLRVFYRLFHLRRLLGQCDVVFFPGGLLLPLKVRRISMCQNLQPFIPEDRKRASGWQRLRVEILKFLLDRSFRKSDKTIFVSGYSQEIVEKSVGVVLPSEIIPHGCSEEFFEVGRCRDAGIPDALNIIYVSTINTYKNHDVAVNAVKRIRDEGVPATITLVGGGYEPSLSENLSLFKKLDPSGEWIFYRGKLSYDGVIEELKNANCGIFLSTCETFGLSLVESMAAGLPMICSNVRPMSDLVGNAAFKIVDPFDVEAVADALRQLHAGKNKFSDYRDLSVRQASKFTWSVASDMTFKLISGKNQL